MMLMSTLTLSVWLSVLVNSVFSRITSESGMVTYDEGYGCSNVVISAPHGGWKKSGYSTRPSNGCYSDGGCYYNATSCTDGDSKAKCKTVRTKERSSGDMSTRLAAKILEHTENAVKPYVIRCDLHRSKLDANRAIEEATFGNEKAEQVYNEYHSFIEHALDVASAGSKQVLYIDIHGQVESNPNTVIGYMIENEPEGLNLTTLPNSLAPSTSLAHLFTTAGQTLEELVRGNSSIGGLMEMYDPGVKVVPSPNNPRSLSGAWYTPGYSLPKYTADSSVSGMKVNVRKYILAKSSRRAAMADTLGRAVADWLNDYY